MSSIYFCIEANTPEEFQDTLRRLAGDGGGQHVAGERFREKAEGSAISTPIGAVGEARTAAEVAKVNEPPAEEAKRRRRASKEGVPAASLDEEKALEQPAPVSAEMPKDDPFPASDSVGADAATDFLDDKPAESAKIYTIADVRAKLTDVIGAKGLGENAARRIVNDAGAAKVGELDPVKYPSVIAACEAALAGKKG